MTASLTVLGGPLAGTRLEIDDAADEILVGSDPDCRLSLDLPGVSPIHARLWLDDAGITVHDTRSPRGVYVNDARVEAEAPLRDGDVLWLGTPGDDASVRIQYRANDEGVAVEQPPAIIDDVRGDAHSVPAAGPSAEDILFGEPAATAPTDALGDFAELLETAPAAAPAPEPAPEPAPFEPEPFEPEPEALEPTPAPPPAASQALPEEAMFEPPVVAAEPDAGFGQPRDDVFFMEEPAGAEPSPPVEPPPAAEPPAEASNDEAPAFVTDDELPFAEQVPHEAQPAEGAPADDLFFVETDAPPAVAAPPPPPEAIPPPAPPPPSPPPRAASTARPSPPEVAAVVGTGGAAAPPRSARRAGPTPMPSAALDTDDEAPPARVRSAPPRPAPARRGSSPPIALLAGGAVLLAALVAGGLWLMRSSRPPAVASITPARVGLGQSVTITGEHFAPTPQGNLVQFAGKPGRVVDASATRLQVEIPELDTPPGRDTPVPVVVVVDGRESKTGSVAVFLAPRIHGIAPNVAMPGEDVVLAGAGWGAGARVQFAGQAAEVLDASPTSLKVKVPALDPTPGREYPVTVAMGADASNPAPFLVGRLPLLLSLTPAPAAPGDLVVVAGRGFDARPAANDVRVSGTRALVVSASGSELKIVVPRVAPGSSPMEVRVAGTENVATSTLAVSGAPDPIDFHFVAEPYEDAPGHDHAVMGTGLGPAFVLSGTPGKPAAVRAFEAEHRLNEAAGPLKASIDADVRARGLDGNPMLVLLGRDVPLLDVTPEDAAGYEEDWTGAKGRGGAVTPARLATWWEAVARDLVLLLVRGEKPHFAADLAPEGRVFGDIHQLARKSVTSGVPRQVVAEAKGLRDAVRVAALHVPASVKGAAPETSSAGASTTEPSAAPAAPAGPALKLDGRWAGTENDADGGGTKYLTIVFSGATGTLTYERAISLSQPVMAVEQNKSAMRFLMQTGGGPRYFQGKWDGQKIAGTISADQAGKIPLGTFELTPR
ncbi:MAG: hypothetical protein DMF78_06570 [Acidobacteria bacterium]|nr:MAG: hypothetical protein DMF78_06570 [Acidobacteriota bacterium]